MTDTQFEPFEKIGTFSDTSFTLIMFNATITAATAIVDTGFRQRAKNWLRLWYQSGTNLWKEIKRTTTDIPEAVEVYEELSGYIYEVSRIALNQTDYEQFLNHIKEWKPTQQPTK